MLTLRRRHQDWQDWNDLLVWNKDLEQLFGAASAPPASGSFEPAVDIVEEPGRFVLRADLPGVNEDAIEVKVLDGTLVLSGSRSDQTDDEGSRAHYRERRNGAFARRFRLGSAVDSTKVEASYKNGVLTVSLPKREEVQPRKIPIVVS